MKLHNLFRTIGVVCISIIPSAYAGVIISCELPRKISEVIQKQQKLLHTLTQKINAQKDTAYLFQEAQFAPHLSLAFVSQNTLSVAQICEQYPALCTDLQNIAEQNVAIDITSNLVDATIEYWPGTFEIECNGLTKKNYYNVVLKLADNQALNYLADRLHRLLQEKYGIIQRFPFSAHITIGRICEQDDQSIDAADLQMLSDILLTNMHTWAPQGKIELTTVTLNGHDHSEIVLSLAK